MDKFSIHENVKNSGETTLRKTCKHDGTKARYYAQIEVLGRTYYRRIRKDTYNVLSLHTF